MSHPNQASRRNTGIVHSNPKIEEEFRARLALGQTYKQVVIWLGISTVRVR